MSDLLLDSMLKFDKSNISSYIKDLLMNQLLEGKLKPGDKLPTENEFAAKLGVGRNSIREAMKMLSSLGIIEVKRGMGTYIRETISDSVLNPLIVQLAFSGKSSQELIELRIFLDTAVAELALEKIQDGDLVELEETNEKLLDELLKNQPNEKTLVKLDFEFHMKLISITRNNLIIKISETIYILFFSSIDETIRYQQEKEVGYRNHVKIINALKNRNKEDVRNAVSDSLEHWRKRLEEK